VVRDAQRPIRKVDRLRRCTLSGVARERAMNPRQLNRLLEREGCTYRELLDEARCGLALRLICLTDLSLGQIALVLDYSSASAFTHAFKRWKAVSPLAWRRLHGRTITTAANMHDSR
jgi:AraC-like DNA-binding protein